MNDPAFDYTKTCSLNNTLPLGYTAPVIRLTAAELVDTDKGSRFISVIKKPVWGMTIENQYKKFSKPISLFIYKDGNYYFAENDTLDILSEGSSIQESIDNALAHIKHFYEYYLSLPDVKFTKKALELKSIYNNLI